MEEKPSDLPWWTEEEKGQAAKELHFLKQPTIVDKQQTNVYRDLNWMYFRRAVLDKYRNNEYCDIGSEYVSFLQQQDDKKKGTGSIMNTRKRDKISALGLVLRENKL